MLIVPTVTTVTIDFDENFDIDYNPPEQWEMDLIYKAVNEYINQERTDDPVPYGSTVPLLVLLGCLQVTVFVTVNRQLYR